MMACPVLQLLGDPCFGIELGTTFPTVLFRQTGSHVHLAPVGLITPITAISLPAQFTLIAEVAPPSPVAGDEIISLFVC